MTAADCLRVMAVLLNDITCMPVSINSIMHDQHQARTLHSSFCAVQ